MIPRMYVLSATQVGAPARVGLVAPSDVMVPAGNTGLDPSQTNFFQVTCARQYLPQFQMLVDRLAGL